MEGEESKIHQLGERKPKHRSSESLRRRDTKTDKIRTLTITVMSPDADCIETIANAAVTGALLDDKTTIEVHVGKVEEIPDGTKKE